MSAIPWVIETLMLIGHLDYLGSDRISGWARDDDDAERRLVLELYDGEQRIARFVADKMRTDLANAGLGDGRYGFWLQLPPSLFPMPAHRISVRFVETGLDIGGSPKILYRAEAGLDEAFARWVDDQVDAAIVAADRPELLEPLLTLSTNITSRVVAALDRFNTLNQSTALKDIDLSSLPELLRRSAEQASGGPKPIHVPVQADPSLSIVIAASGRLGDDTSLVRSIVQTAKGLAYEIILVDNSGAVETALLPFLVRGGARVVRIDKPTGVMAAYAEGARLSRGRTLFFATGLRDIGQDTLRFLADTLDREGREHLVAPRLVDGERLAAAGLSIDSLGNKSAIGQGMHVSLTRFRVLREADDVALNAFMVDRKLFDAIGGLQAAPAFLDYATTHLCFAVKAGGGRVLVQSAADAVLAGPLAGFSARGRGRSPLQARWSAALPKVGEAVSDSEKPVALMIDEHFPTPDEDAASGAIQSHARCLKRLGYHVEFVAMESAKTDPALARALRARGVEAHDEIGSAAQFLAARPGQFDLIYMHRYHVARSMIGPARSANPKACLIFSVADLHHIRAERSRVVTGEPDDLVVKTMRDEELACIGQADVTLTHSTWERDHIREQLPAANVAVALWDIPVEEPQPDAEQKGICFLGSYRHAPNADAIAHFGNAIWPHVPEAIRLDGFDIAGSHSNLLKGIALPPDSRLVGYVKDVRHYLMQRRLMVAPLRFGAGVKGKVLLSLAVGLPCIMSPIAAEGIALPSSLAAVLVGENDMDFVRKLEALYDDQSLWEDISQQSRDWVRAALSQDAVTTSIADALAAWCGPQASRQRKAAG
jgi:glycosyltransferase involved in cell wall biosynthesis